MAPTTVSPPVNHETCPNEDCKFNNVSGAEVCEKCGRALTGEPSEHNRLRTTDTYDGRLYRIVSN
ncbi:hypothetical protein BDV95DRAFT_576570 [Massariosphaeria phaeospora]|uniref:Uncharacterized protein n=1 Tax=Massariosphaeria phaeospora TaxID=100035 RepID=A0A7C8M7H2_9PLEO|nr:hypothetical protein BDV95DRAFT_576570 [Massariosphaeria phaeospora]